MRVINDNSRTWYVVVPWFMRERIAEIYGNNNNVKRIIYAHDPEKYDFRILDEKKIVSDPNEIFIGTYPMEITQYLKYLRFNIRKPELLLER